MRTADVHCHYIPPALVDRIRSDGAERGITLVESDRGDRVSFAGKDMTQPFPPGMFDIEARLEWMDQAGIDVQVLSAWMDFSAYVLDPEPGAWLTRSLNELTMEAIASHGSRFRAMAAVPLQDSELAAKELHHAVEQLGMVGVEIATSVVDREIDDEELDPFWAAASELDVVVLIHPYASIGSDRLQKYFLNNIVGNPAEETVAAAHLIFGGVLERHPRLRVCLTHGGGFLPYQIGRQNRGFDAVPHFTRQHEGSPPSEQLRRFFYDTIVHSPEALRFLCDRVGHDRVLLGSDQPFPMGDPDPLRTVRDAGLSDEAVAAIVWGNAAAAFGLEER